MRVCPIDFRFCVAVIHISELLSRGRTRLGHLLTAVDYVVSHDGWMVQGGSARPQRKPTVGGFRVCRTPLGRAPLRPKRSSLCLAQAANWVVRPWHGVRVPKVGTGRSVRELSKQAKDRLAWHSARTASMDALSQGGGAGDYYCPRHR